MPLETKFWTIESIVSPHNSAQFGLNPQVGLNPNTICLHPYNLEHSNLLMQMKAANESNNWVAKKYFLIEIIEV